ncbi:MAG: hypothetical protein ABL931_03390 [Usitatibacteraceae bacterium]
MIAAVPDRPHSLELVRLILSLVRERSSIPPQLKKHLIDVIDEARRLADDPKIVGSVSPEAIELAVEIRQQASLAASLRGVTSFDSIDPALAGELLGRMVPHAA